MPAPPALSPPPWHAARPRRSGAARRAQAQRAQGRAVQVLLRCFVQLASHRGCQPTQLGSALSRLLSVHGSPGQTGCASDASPNHAQGCASDASPSPKAPQGCASDASPNPAPPTMGCVSDASPYSAPVGCASDASPTFATQGCASDASPAQDVAQGCVSDASPYPAPSGCASDATPNISLHVEMNVGWHARSHMRPCPALGFACIHLQPGTKLPVLFSMHV